jgi:hypothetical protein
MIFSNIRIILFFLSVHSAKVIFRKINLFFILIGKF